ncbi:MAG: EVE domain-containing protein, partial [Candidatus Pacebacteria bacterium]|nr:EVE domain-containing protein [Candidatus Paceibacterota bacterium]
EKVGSWTDVRNYQARNFLRAMRKGDLLLFYHSSCAVPAIVGIAKVVNEAYPDPTQFEPKYDGYDPKSTKENPRWSTVDVSLVEIFKEPLSLAELKADKRFVGMEVTKQGSRLSVQSVSEKHFKQVLQLQSKKKL